MRYLATVVALVLAATLALAQDGRISWKYQAPLLAQDSVLSGLQSIRALAYGNDIDGDGKKEIAVTNYNQNGYVHVFEVVGNDSLKLVWTSPRIWTGGGGSTPRVVAFGDLDGDGKGEVIFQSNAIGIFVYEWDGVVGSDNYGTAPAQKLEAGTGLLQNSTGNAEYMEVTDMDGDGQQELSVAYNANSNATDIYYIFSIVGTFDVNDPGFSTWTKEYEGVRTSTLLTKVGLGGGSPYAIISAQLDGTGMKEAIVHNWNRKNVVPMRVTAANTYELSDTNSTKYNFYLGGASDDVALFGGMAFDVDDDGREEVYLPTYQGRSLVHMISYMGAEATSIIDSANIASLNFSSVVANRGFFGVGHGDIDRDNKPDIYVTSTPPYNVLSAEFQGGDKRDPANWTYRVVYAGETGIVDAMSIRDSAGATGGAVDTVKTLNTAFPSKTPVAKTDIDGDGYEDIVLPMQAYIDSISVTKRTWNSGTSQYDTTKYKIVSPYRFALRVLEGLVNTGVEAKDWTVITPSDYVLEQNYPNPFNPSTTIRFSLPVRERVSLRIYDIAGREVRTLLNNEDRPVGASEVVWDGRNSAGQTVASGVYFYTLSWGNFAKTNKMTMLK